MKMDDLIKLIKRDPIVQIKRRDILDKYNRLLENYQSETGCDTLIQNVLLKELINIMGATITDIDIEIKMKISKRKYLESIVEKL